MTMRDITEVGHNPVDEKQTKRVVSLFVFFFFFFFILSFFHLSAVKCCHGLHSDSILVNTSVDRIKHHQLLESENG